MMPRRRTTTRTAAAAARKQQPAKGVKVEEEATNEKVAEEATEEKIAEEATEEKIAEEATDEKIAEEATDEKITEEATDEKIAEEATDEKIAEEAPEKETIDDKVCEDLPADVDQDADSVKPEVAEEIPKEEEDLGEHAEEENHDHDDDVLLAVEGEEDEEEEEEKLDANVEEKEKDSAKGSKDDENDAAKSKLAKRVTPMNSPTVHEHHLDRELYYASRTVWLAPVTLGDLSDVELFDWIQKTQRFHLHFSKPNEDGFEGSLELNFSELEEARECAESLNQTMAREGLTVLHAYPKENKAPSLSEFKKYEDPLTFYKNKVPERTLVILNASEVALEDLQAQYPTAVNIIKPYSYELHADKGYVFVEFPEVKDVEKEAGKTITIKDEKYRTFRLNTYIAPKTLVSKIEWQLRLLEDTEFLPEQKRELLVSYARQCKHYEMAEFVEKPVKRDISSLKMKITSRLKKDLFQKGQDTGRSPSRGRGRGASRSATRGATRGANRGATRGASRVSLMGKRKMPLLATPGCEYASSAGKRHITDRATVGSYSGASSRGLAAARRTPAVRSHSAYDDGFSYEHHSQPTRRHEAPSQHRYETANPIGGLLADPDTATAVTLLRGLTNIIKSQGPSSTSDYSRVRATDSGRSYGRADASYDPYESHDRYAHREEYERNDRWGSAGAYRSSSSSYRSDGRRY